MNRQRLLILCMFAFLVLPFALHAQQTKEQLASYYFSHGEYEKAVELYEPLYDKTSNRFYYQMLCQAYVELHEYRKAESLIGKRIKRFPKETSLYVDWGNLLEKKGDTKKALKKYDEGLEKIGFDTRQVSDMALAFDNIGRLDYAVKVYLAARAKSKNSYLYVSELASLYARMGDYDAMMKEYFDLLDNSPGSMGSIQISLQKLMSETSNPQMEEGLRRMLVRRVQAQPENKLNLDMMIWFSLQQKDFPFAFTQAKAVDARFPDLKGEPLMRVAQIAHSNGAFDVALDCYSILVKKGAENPYYFDSRVGELQVSFARINSSYPLLASDRTVLEARYRSAFDELGKNLNTVPLMRDYAKLMAYYSNDVQAASDILYDILDIPKLPPKVRDEVKLELGDLLLFAGEIWDASLLYMQVEKANKEDVLGSKAKFKNAKLSYFNHDFLWSRSQLEVLRASTTKLIANDAMELSLLISDNMEEDSTFDMLELFADADLLLYRNQLDAAWDGFDAITRRTLSHPLFDEVLMKKAQIRMKQGRYLEADSLLAHLCDFYADDILADDALMMRAELNEIQLKNIEQARLCYEKLILDYPSSLYVARARNRYNEMKQ